MTDQEETSGNAAGRTAAAPVSLGVLIFAFGVAAGFLVAFSGTGFLADSAGVIVSIFLVTIFLVALAGVLAFLLRRPILRHLFGIVETQLESFAGPLAETARAAAGRDPDGAITSARELLQLALARYGWLLMRRWVVLSLTGLIAAMAALAGTALLFSQNELLRNQSRLMTEQNARIAEQSALLEQDVQLAEAARNAQVAVEVIKIAELLGRALDKANAADPGQAGPVPVLDPAVDLDMGLIMRIAAASQSARPYRFLDIGGDGTDVIAENQVAMLRRRADLGQSYARMAAGLGWKEIPGQERLIDRPFSPERGQLLRALVLAGVHEFETLSHFGLDLSYAFFRGDGRLLAASLQGAKMSYADLSGAQVVGTDFSGAWLQNARFRHSRLERSSFSTISADKAKGPFRAVGGTYPVFLAGADFTDATLVDVVFGGARGGAMSFDGATLVRCSFGGAVLSAATFRGAVLIDPDFAGAVMRSVDFDGAYVFDPDFLTRLQQQADPGSFVADRFAMTQVQPGEVFAVGSAGRVLDPGSLAAAAGSDKAWRITRVASFEN